MELSGGMTLLLAILSSASMAVVLKLFQKDSGNRFAIIIGNYVTCVVLAFLLLPSKDVILHPDPVTVVLGLAGGILFVAGLVSMQSSIAANGAILTSAFSRLGLLVPLLLSILIYSERPGGFQLAGLALVFAAIWLVSGERKTQSENSPMLLLVVLLSCGGADAMAKIFEHAGRREQDNLYFLYVFAMAALLTLFLLIREYRLTGKRVLPGDLLAGIAVGIPNYFSSMLLLKALVHLPAFIVYPCFSTGAILMVTLAGILLFGEHLAKRQWAGLGMIAAALVLLNL